jgi:hypothetical protein
VRPPLAPLSEAGQEKVLELMNQAAAVLEAEGITSPVAPDAAVSSAPAPTS